ncbi:MAG: hypothetical protein LIO44_06375 [Eubacterium sp.]|nr:hypothetical protein [Eubacterium sp.]
MSVVKVVVVYNRRLKYVEVDGVDMDIFAVEDKPLKEWFEPSSGRDGWEGLIPEIQRLIDDESSPISFEFQGSKEDKFTFEQCLKELGLGENADGLSADDTAEKNLSEAKRAEHKGLYKVAFDYYLKAADYGNSAEAQY